MNGALADMKRDYDIALKQSHAELVSALTKAREIILSDLGTEIESIETALKNAEGILYAI